MKKGIISEMIVQIYKLPSIFSEVVDEVLYGMSIEIIDEVNEKWCFINTKYNFKGYVKKELIQFSNEIIENWSTLVNINVYSNFANVLNVPSPNGLCLKTLVKGSVLCSVDKRHKNGYVNVMLVNGQKGYIKKNFVNINTSKGISEDIIFTAKQYLGTQYKQGGKTPIGIDSAGLVSMSYLINGSIIDRNIVITEEFCPNVIEMDIMNPGDILCFDKSFGIYIGNGDYVHINSEMDCVAINSLIKGRKNYNQKMRKKFLYVYTVL